MVLILLDDHDQSLFTRGLVLNKTLPFLGPCRSLSGQLPFPHLPCTRILVHFGTYAHLYVQAEELFSSSLPLIYLYFLVPLTHSSGIELLRFTTESPRLLPIPPNQ